MSKRLEETLAFLDAAITELEKPARPAADCPSSDWRRYKLDLDRWAKQDADAHA